MTSYGQLDQLIHQLVNLTTIVNLSLWCISSGGQLTFDDTSIKQLQVNTHENLADLFTKALPEPIYQDLTYKIGILSDQGGVLE